MSNARSTYIRGLATLLVIAGIPLGALAQDDFSVPRFQPVAPFSLVSPSTAGAQATTNAPANATTPFDTAQDSTQVAENVTAALPASPAYSLQTQPAPPPPQVRKVERQVKRKVRRWRIGGRIGEGFSPELFMFGLQSEIGPIFNPRLIFRPNVEFGFGELTDMFDINLEAAYRLHETIHGRWTPYFGMGPSLNFLHRGASSGDVSFSDFGYETGFNVFLGAQKDRTFVEIKTSLWSGETPVLRLFLGYNF